MNMKKLTAVLLAMTALTSCSMPNPDFGKVDDEIEVTTAAKETEIPETTTKTAATTTKTTAKTTSSAATDKTTATSSAEQTSTTVATTLRKATKEEMYPEVEKWKQAYYKVLDSKAYGTVMSGEAMYMQILNLNDEFKPQIMFFSDNGAHFAVYNCDDYGIEHLIAFANDYSGNRYMYNKKKGYSFGHRVSASATSECFQLKYFQPGNIHEHEHGLRHNGLCLDDFKTLVVKGEDWQNLKSFYSFYGIDYKEDDPSKLILDDGWTELGPDNPYTVKLELGEERELLDKIIESYLDDRLG